jgi:SNF2 family DNA or RNA helicase
MWLCNLKQFGFGGILADDMGLGKSLQILAYLLKDMAATAGKAKTLLVVPKTLVNNWELEILKFAPSLKYSIRRDRKKPLSVDKSDLIITTYGLIRTAADQFEPIVWQNLILDEAQYIKNYYTQTGRALRGIRARTRLALTGTPLENSLTDLFSIFDFLMPGFLGTMKSFKQRYHQNRPQDLETLGQLTKPFLLRRLKKQVCHELPSKTEISILCELSKTQAEVYRETLSVERSKLREPGLADNAVNMLTVLLRLRQIACHLKLLDGISVASSGKLDSVLQMAEEILAEGHSILIFSQFTQHLDIVKKAIQKLSVHQYYLDGGTKDRMAVVTAFQDDVRPAVFLISLKTGGVGLNLTRANYVFLLDPWWNPAVENQAIDRCYRIGQSDPVTVYRFISKDTIEEKIMKLKALKKQIEESVILTAGADQIPLSESDLKWLIFEE